MLRTIRLTLAIIFFALVTLLFLDFTGTLHGWMGWMAKIQFLPALLALNVGGIAACCIDLAVRTRLLFRYLSARRISGCHFPVCGQTEEKPLPLLSRKEMAALWDAGIVCRHPHCGGTLSYGRFAARAVQLLWAYRFQSFRSRLPVGQQSAGIPGGTGGQLRFL